MADGTQFTERFNELLKQKHEAGGFAYCGGKMKELSCRKAR